MDTYKSTMFPIYLAILTFFWIGCSDFIRISYINKDPKEFLKVKRRKIPRIPLACIACMYLYLLNAALRLFLFQDSLRDGVQIFSFTGMFTLVCILSILNLLSIPMLYDIGAYSQIKKGWIALKLAFIPFLPLNAWLFEHTMNCIEIEPEVIFVYAFIFLPLLPFFLLLYFLIPLIFPLVINVANGCIGISYIRYLRQRTGNSRQPSGYHFGVQMVPGLDLISALFILIKYRKSRLGTETAETESITLPYPCVAQSPYTQQISYAGRSPHGAQQSPYATPTTYVGRPPYTFQPPYANLFPYTYNTTSAVEPKIYKKLKKHRKFLFLLYLLCGILFYFGSEIVDSTAEVHEEVTAEETAFYEMTDEEIALIQDHYFDNEAKEKIAAGQLTGFQAELLENLRNGYSYIESKYPGRQFQIKEMHHRYNDSYYMRDTLDTVLPEASYYSLRIVPVQPSDRVYQMEFSTSPDSVVEDNLYAYLQEESYFRYIEDRLASEIPGFAKVDTDEWYDWHMAEYEDPADLTVEAVLNGEYLAGPRFLDVYISANGKTTDECKRQEETLSKIFRRIELPVQRYTIRYYDLTIEEILADDFNPDDTIAAFAIHQDLPEGSP